MRKFYDFWHQKTGPVSGSCTVLWVHNLGDGFQNLIVAAAAAGRAVGNGLDLVEGLFHIGKLFAFFHSVLYIEPGHLHTIANRVIFHTNSPFC